MQPVRSRHQEPSDPAEAEPALAFLGELEAAPEPQGEPRLCYGKVIDAGALTVRFDDHTRPATRAKSCLVAAEAGDRVLCALDGDHAFVLAVLQGAVATRIETEGPLSLKAGGELGLEGERFKLRAKHALVAVDELRLLGRSIEASITDRAALYAERVESRATRFLQRAKTVYRFVEQLEQVRAGHLDMRAEGLAAIRGENTIVGARVLAKLDGEQVKIG